jgi:hypothetical protein
VLAIAADGGDAARMKPDRVTVTVLFAAGAFMLWAADYYTVFDDEAFSTQRYVLPLGELMPALWRGVEPDPPLYYVLQHGWVYMFGVRPLPLRGLSILFFLISLPILRAAARTLFDERTSRWAIVLCGLNPLHLFFGFAARWYALMFLCTTILLLMQATLLRREEGWHGRGFGRPCIGWTLAAVAACYTNYFGVCVVGLLWAWGMWRDRARRRQWAIMGGATLLAYGPWLWPFVREVARFPRFDPDVYAYAVTAARSVVALLTGNLASPAAWYAWAPLVVFVAGASLLALRDARKIVGLVWLAGGCLVIGTLSRVLIDKYVMTFSAAVWLAAAAALAAERTGRWRTVRVVAVGALCVAWAGCGLNWAMERHWSSLRWLDPFRMVVRENVYADLIVATHPSVRYYYGILDPQHWTGRMPPDHWRRRAAGVHEPREAIEQLQAAWHGPPARDSSAALPSTVCVIRTADIAADSDQWADLLALLAARYEVAGEQAHLADPHAALKDRLDPAYRHPTHRIVVTVYRLSAPR